MKAKEDCLNTVGKEAEETIKAKKKKKKKKKKQTKNKKKTNKVMTLNAKSGEPLPLTDKMIKDVEKCFRFRRYYQQNQWHKTKHPCKT